MENQNEPSQSEKHRPTPKEQTELPLINLPFMLRQARIDAGKTIADVASQLYLKPHVVESLENEDFYTKEKLTIFMRGYIRNYARLLNIPAERIQAAFDELGIRTKAEVSPTFKFEENKPFPIKQKQIKIISYSIIAVLFILILIWRLPHHDAKTNDITTDTTSGMPTNTIITDDTIPIITTSGQETTTAAQPAKKDISHPKVWQDPDFMSQQTAGGATQ